VPAGSVGVVTRFSAINRVAEPGIGMKVPFVESSHEMSVRNTKDQCEASAMSENLQVVTSTIAINYHLDGLKAITVYQNIWYQLCRPEHRHHPPCKTRSKSVPQIHSGRVDHQPRRSPPGSRK